MTIEVISSNGQPSFPTKNANAFIRQCGVIVRDNIPINCREWKKPKKDQSATFVSDRLKEVCWKKLISFFTLPKYATEEETKEKNESVKRFALSKMASQFNKFKNNLYRDYLKNGEPKVWNGPMVKQREYWPEFLQMKKSALFLKRSQINTVNAGKKKKHHGMGTGGYRSKTPGWIELEEKMMAAGIMPETAEWDRRHVNYILGHGAEYDLKTGQLIAKKPQIVEPLAALREAIKDRKEGRFKPDREKDELTKALGNDEKPGRTRGYGPTVSWKHGFAESHTGEQEGSEPYRSRARGKRRLEEKHSEEWESFKLRQQTLEAEVRQMKEEMRAQRAATHQLQLEDPAVQGSQRKSSVASTAAAGATDDDEAQLIDRFPVDTITEKTNCELHIIYKNLSLSVARGYALPCGPEARWHGNEIPAGYARIAVDEIEKGYDRLELEYATPEGEKTLQEVGSGIIIWPKKDIHFPHLVQNPQPSSSPPHGDSGHGDDDPHSPHQSPPPHQPSPSPRQPSPPPRQPSPPPPPPAKSTKVNPRKRDAKLKIDPYVPKKTKIPEVSLKPLPMRPYDYTEEENAEIAAAHHAKWRADTAAAKIPEPPVIYSQKDKKWAFSILTGPSQKEMAMQPDYERSLEKMYESSLSRSSGKTTDASAVPAEGGKGVKLPAQGGKRVKVAKKKRDVPQLGEQSKKTISPLKVGPSRRAENTLTDTQKYQLQFAAEVGMTLIELDPRSNAPLPAGTATVAFQYVSGGPMVPPGVAEDLPTRLRSLNNWYEKAAKRRQIQFYFCPGKDHFLGQDHAIPIEFRELFQFFNLRDIDVTIVSAYSL